MEIADAKGIWGVNEVALGRTGAGEGEEEVSEKDGEDGEGRRSQTDQTTSSAELVSTEDDGDNSPTEPTIQSKHTLSISRILSLPLDLILTIGHVVSMP